MFRAISNLPKHLLLKQSLRTILISPMSGIKLRTSKKSSSTVFAELSSDYLQRFNEDHLKDTKKNKKGQDVSRKNLKSKNIESDEKKVRRNYIDSHDVGP